MQFTIYLGVLIVVLLIALLFTPYWWISVVMVLIIARVLVDFWDNGPNNKMHV